MITVAALALSATRISLVLVDPNATYDYACQIHTPKQEKIAFTARISGMENQRIAQVIGKSAHLIYGKQLPVRQSEDGMRAEIIDVDREGLHYAYVFSHSWGEAILTIVTGIDPGAARWSAFQGAGFCTKRDVKLEGMQR